MNDYKLTFKLKQHTPIIHFQHEQHGATLRASELKPKLDKYLIKKFEEDGKDFFDWLIKGQEKALNYKVKITASSIMVNEIEIRDNPTYFGEMGQKDEKEKKKYTSDNSAFELIIYVFNKELKDNIEKHFPSFIALTNFGTRQNKGNGSFYIDISDKLHFKNIEKILPKGTPFCIIKSLDDKDIFQMIDYYYKRLKAGINFNYDNKCKGEYHKSFLFQYYNNITNKGWEKRYIKEEFFGLYKDGVEKFFIRALLGLPGNFTYKKTLEPCHKKNDKSIPSTYEIKDDYEIEVYHPAEVERYKSPITFKPIKFQNMKETRIYIIPEIEMTIQNITNKTFFLYKKFITKKLFTLNGELRKGKPQTIPIREGTKVSDVNEIIKDLGNQENQSAEFDKIIEKIPDFKKKNREKKYLENYILGQKARLTEYLNDCKKKDGKYYPPFIPIEIPGDNFDLKSLIKKYDDDELKNSFSFNDISAEIKIIL